MSAFMRYARLAAVAGLIGLVGCGSTSRSPARAGWPQYWATQYSWLNGHQPWLSSPSSVVQVWAGGYGSASVVRQVSANTFKVTKPDGKTFTVTGVRPVSVPGPWVITKIA